MSLQQYLHYLPVPQIDADECNSTKHYNGHIDTDKICAGYTDSEKSPCYVSIYLYYRLTINITFFLNFVYSERQITFKHRNKKIIIINP